MNALSLCAGVGGLDLGLNLALDGGLRTVGYVEREAFSAAIIVARMEDKALDRAPIWDDLRTFQGEPYRGRVDLVFGGYPCQPFSSAGARAGSDDPHHLWPEFARIIREVGARYVFLENVRGHVSLGLSDVLGSLAELGFNAEWGVFSSAEVGAPHRRERVFILAWRVSDAKRNPLRLESERGAGRTPAPNDGRSESGALGGDLEHASGNESERLSSGEATEEPRPGDPSSDLADTNGNGREGLQQTRAAPRSTIGDRGDLAHPNSGGQQRGSEQDIEPSAGLGAPQRDHPDGCSLGTLYPPGPKGDWSRIPPEAQPAICGMADGLASRNDRLRAIGNGVDALAAAHAFRTLWART